jgi:hypothetical protein
MNTKSLVSLTTLFGSLLLTSFAMAQAPGAGARPAPRVAKAAAPVDLTGYWVSIVTEDWRWRMVTPIKGDFASIPVNAEARKIGEAWDPAKDEAAGQQCKAYGAPAIMRIPGRLHITWQDDQTLKVETDQGQQTRLFHFAATAPANTQPTIQGYSIARWEGEVLTLQTQNLGGAAQGSQVTGQGKSLEVFTNNLRPGYLRKNGIPYSANTTVTENFDYQKAPNGTEWFTVTTVVTDPTYLRTPWVTSTDFRKEADGGKWDPVACTAR